MTVLQELQFIEQENGILRPEDVVAYARNKKTTLHSKFTWDDGKAAYQYRLWQARMLINVAVTVIERDDVRRVTRAFVSLTTDRGNTGGGYRGVVSVLSNAEYKAQLLKDAMAEAQLFRRKYRALSELAKVFDAIDELSREAEREIALVS